MNKQFDIYYNDGVYYGSIAFTDKTREEIEKVIQEEKAKKVKYQDMMEKVVSRIQELSTNK
jgi:uncharacterized coiled-coil protein SlyX